jgi:uncharacterized protein
VTARGSGKPPSGGLAARLGRMKEHGALKGRAENGSPGGPARLRGEVKIVTGWEAMTEFVWRRRLSVPVSGTGGFAPSPLLPMGGELEDFVFFDIETTGLSGGAGTLAFLVGFGWVKTGSLEVEQFFLRDYPGEGEFLDLINSSMDNGKTFVSYNGKAFDTQILKTRMIMNSRTLPVVAQLDLLYPSRRLWQNALPSCSLGSIEEHVLGLTREDDVPGMLVPDIYFSFLETGETGELERVFAHHFQDIVSLERLLCHITRVVADISIDPGVDRCRLGRWMLDTGFGEGAGVLAEAFAHGDNAAGYHLGKYLKRTRAFGEAAAVWETMLTRDGDLTAAFELAKFAEHKLRDYPLAQGYVSRILEAVNGAGDIRTPEPVDRLEHRIERIRRKARFAHR